MNLKEILEKAFYGPITPQIPASILQLHPDITVIYSENQHKYLQFSTKCGILYKNYL